MAVDKRRSNAMFSKVSKEFHSQYMTYSEYIDDISKPRNKFDMHYYLADEPLPEPLHGDFSEPTFTS